MSKTKIPWADVSWNPVTGCSPISEGCARCYAARMAKRLAGRFGYPDAPNQFDVTVHPDRLNKTWPSYEKKIFACSMSDMFHDLVPAGFINLIMTKVVINPQHTFMFLTKRPLRMETCLRGASKDMVALDYEYLLPLNNLWLGVTAENQNRADERIPVLLQIPAAVRFVSVEPMLGPVDLGFPAGANPRNQKYPKGYGKWSESQKDEWAEGAARATYIARCSVVDWVIAGPETGPKARPCDPKWIEDLYEQCKAAGVPFFDKSKKPLAREFPK